MELLYVLQGKLSLKKNSFFWALTIDQIAQVSFPSQGDLESEVEELGERSLEASKLVEPRENSYIEFRVCSQFYVEDSK